MILDSGLLFFGPPCKFILNICRVADNSYTK